MNGDALAEQARGLPVLVPACVEIRKPLQCLCERRLGVQLAEEIHRLVNAYLRAVEVTDVPGQQPEVIDGDRDTV